MEITRRDDLYRKTEKIKTENRNSFVSVDRTLTPFVKATFTRKEASIRNKWWFFEMDSNFLNIFLIIG